MHFQEVINEVNAKRKIAGNVMMDILTTMQTKSETTLTKLLALMKSTFSA